MAGQKFPIKINKKGKNHINIYKSVMRLLVHGPTQRFHFKK